MKPDDQLKRDVLEELGWDSTVTANDINVATHNGVVTLSGSVPHFADKAAAERAAQRVGGVKVIAEEMDVNLMLDHHREDTEIALAVANSLKWHVWIPAGLHAIVENGWVTLEGQARFGFERTSAMDAVRFLKGIKGVFNNITLKPSIELPKVQEAIENALQRNAEIDAAHVVVTAIGGSVILTGTIRSWGEREEAGTAAWNAPGVTEVQNNLAVI